MNQPFKGLSIIIIYCILCLLNSLCMAASSSSSSSSSASSSTSSSVALADFMCTINMSLPRCLTETPCGHIFEYADLSKWLKIDSVCPQCRTPIASIEQCHVSLFLQRILAPFLPAIDVDLGNHYDNQLYHDTLATATVPIQPTPSAPPRSMFTIDQLTNAINIVNSLDDEQYAPPITMGSDDDSRPASPSMPPLIENMDYTATVDSVFNLTSLRLAFRYVLLTLDEMRNPESGIPNLLDNLTTYHHRNFINRHRLNGSAVAILRCWYHHRGTVADAVASAVRHGYYVYDMFASTPNLFVIYTLRFRLDGTYHSLNIRE